MRLRNIAMVGVCLGIGAAVASPVKAQCTASQDAAVQCFANNAVKTGLLTLHYGMTMTQFRAYTISVSKIAQQQNTNLVILGMAGAIADAMPATNADGTSNTVAQTNAINAIVSAEINSGVLTMPAETNQQDIVWFTTDLVTQMNATSGVLLSPGTLLRVIDGYIISQTSNGVVNWTAVNTNLGVMITTLASGGLLRLPPSITATEATNFATSIAQAIYNYKAATNKVTL